jgi:hypothetical protein
MRHLQQAGQIKGLNQQKDPILWKLEFTLPDVFNIAAL